jgi:hypothetical protein
LDTHAARELDVFTLFAECSPLRVLTGSIQKRKPPEPDIACELEGGDGVAFELVELADSIMLKTPADTAVHRKCFNDAIAALCPKAARKFQERYGSGLFHFSFQQGSSLKVRKEGIVGTVKRLASMPRGVNGQVPLPREGLPGIKAVTVRLCDLQGPVFDDTKGVSFKDPAEDSILGKLRRHYQTKRPVDLLAYYHLQPLLPDSHWLPSLVAVLKEELPASQFEILSIAVDDGEVVFTRRAP